MQTKSPKKVNSIFAYNFVNIVFQPLKNIKLLDLKTTLASRIDVGHGINIGPGKFGKKNKHRALNIHILCSKKNI